MTNKEFKKELEQSELLAHYADEINHLVERKGLSWEANSEEAEDFIHDVIREDNIIYNDVAMKYLSENDPSLMLSLELAKDNGYELEKLNSERLASLLHQQPYLEELWRIQAKKD